MAAEAVTFRSGAVWKLAWHCRSSTLRLPRPVVPSSGKAGLAFRLRLAEQLCFKNDKMITAIVAGVV